MSAAGLLNFLFFLFLGLGSCTIQSAWGSWSTMTGTYLGKGAPSNGTVYVCNLPEGTDENMLAEHFGTIGLLKVRRLLGCCII